jgi:hypothetical protein
MPVLGCALQDRFLEVLLIWVLPAWVMGRKCEGSVVHVFLVELIVLG